MRNRSSRALDRPIGIFDSGVGGTTVLRRLRDLLPHRDLLYLADQANCPYGTRTEAELRELSAANTRWLIARGAALIVVGCNTASAAGAAVGICASGSPASPRRKRKKASSTTISTTLAIAGSSQRRRTGAGPEVTTAVAAGSGAATAVGWNAELGGGGAAVGGGAGAGAPPTHGSVAGCGAGIPLVARARSSAARIVAALS